MKQDNEWAYIRVPRKFKENVAKYLSKHPELGYTSVREFFVDVVRERLAETGHLPTAKEVEA